LVSFSPTINQVERMTSVLAAAGFLNIHTIESFIREIRAETGKTRPATVMVGHTGYMTFGQKVQRSGGPSGTGISASPTRAISVSDERKSQN